MAIAWSIRRRPAALWMWTAGTILVLSFTHLLFPNLSLRHKGHLFILLVATMWLAPSFLSSQHEAKQSDPASRLSLAKSALGALLVIHLIASLVAVSVDLSTPFSASAEAARLLRQRGLMSASG